LIYGRALLPHPVGEPTVEPRSAASDVLPNLGEPQRRLRPWPKRRHPLRLLILNPTEEVVGKSQELPRRERLARTCLKRPQVRVVVELADRRLRSEVPDCRRVAGFKIRVRPQPFVALLGDRP